MTVKKKIVYVLVVIWILLACVWITTNQTLRSQLNDFGSTTEEAKNE